MTKRYHLYAVGNALVDAEYEVSDELLATAGVAKRHMTLIDPVRRAELLAHVSHIAPHQTGGGSAGNTVVALAQFGGNGFYSCRVANDELGAFYTRDLIDRGVDTNLTRATPPEGQTGSCMVMVTPDAERSMSTFLGATAELDDSALSPQDIAASEVYYMEGYLAASSSGLAAAIKGRDIAAQAGVKLATTLSDMSMINFCRPGLDAMVGNDLDYLFCNEEEAQVWCGTQDMAAICQQLSTQAKTVCVTRSAKGCIVLSQGQTHEVAATPVKAVDTNGAGDMFAGAFLYAVTQGHSLKHAAWLANMAAGRVVAQYGNRLSVSDVNDLKAAYSRYLQAN